MSDPEITVVKHAAHLQVSRELLADSVFDMEEFLNPSWRTRLRRKVRRQRDRAAIWLYRRVSGHDLPEPEIVDEDE